jgi:SLOG cluster2
VIPELGQVPSMRWAPGREMLAFSVLMREVFFGARNVLAARLRANSTLPGPVLNRLPGPVVLQRLLNQPSYAPTAGSEGINVSYPGNGLPLMELRLLEEIFQNVRLTAFRDVERNLPEPMQTALAAHRRPLDRKVLAISFAVSPQLAELGYLHQHLEEAIIYLLRPLLRLGMDLLYGGIPPKRDNADRSKTTPDPSAGRNMTLTLMHLLNDERSAGETINDAGDSLTQPRPSRLYNPSAWPVSDSITPEDEAAWIKYLQHFARPAETCRTTRTAAGQGAGTTTLSDIPSGGA